MTNIFYRNAYKISKILIIIFLFFNIFIWNYVTKTTILELANNKTHNISLNDVPIDILLTVLIAEDNRFNTHHGYDVMEIYYALRDWVTLQKPLRGASTITQQLARTLFLNSQKTLLRKYLELIIAIKLEYYLTKSQILELYLSHARFDEDSFGLKIAAKKYFKKEIKELEYSEGIILLSLMPAPLTDGKSLQKGKLSVRMREYIRKNATRLGIVKPHKVYPQLLKNKNSTIFNIMGKRNLIDYQFEVRMKPSKILNDIWKNAHNYSNNILNKSTTKAQKGTRYFQ